MMVEKVDEKTMCLETVKAIDLRQRTTRYRVWFGISIIFAIITIAFAWFSYSQFYVSLENFIGKAKIIDFTSFNPYFVIVVLITLLLPVFFWFIILAHIESYLSMMYFPKKESEEK